MATQSAGDVSLPIDRLPRHSVCISIGATQEVSLALSPPSRLWRRANHFGLSRRWLLQGVLIGWAVNIGCFFLTFLYANHTQSKAYHQGVHHIAYPHEGPNTGR